MTWPIPAPGDITDRAAGFLEGEFARVYALRNPTSPSATPDARSPISVLAVLARLAELTAIDLYLYIATLALELMPDTAQEWLPRHGALWGVPQGQPVAASGDAVFAGTPNTGNVVVPGGFALSAPGGAGYATSGAGTIVAGGTVSIAVAAQVAGSAGNLPASTALTPVNPLAGLASVAVDANGLTGGADLESADSWRPRIIQRIRSRGAGGDANDWQQWGEAALPGAIVKAISPGAGSVTVAIAMPGTPPVVPTSAQLATAQAYLGDSAARKPLGMTVTAVAATLTPLDFTLHLNPDTAAIRAAATSALQAWFAQDAAIGGVLEMSRADAALSAADGEFSHDRIAPTADYTAGATVLPILGTVTFQ